MLGRIYRIIHLKSDICYIGSTFNELRYRWQNHRNAFKEWKLSGVCHASLYPYLEQHGIEHFRIVLVKEYEVVDRKHLEAYEQIWISKFKKTCINKNNPFSIPKLTTKLSHVKRKENPERQEYVRQYREDHKDAAAQKKREKYQANREQIRESRRQKTVCGCGGSFTSSDRRKHERTKKHQTWEQTQSE